MSVRPVLSLVAVALLTSALVAGCGGSDKTPAKAADTATATPSALDTPGPTLNPGTGGTIKLEKPKARATISPTATLTAVPGSGQIYSAADARTVRGFPVPKGAKVKDPGAIEETWQFDIATKKPDDVIEFYRQVLPQMGYTVRTDVTYENAYEKVHWDLVFDGQVSGSIVTDKRNHTVFVVVNPPGQPAFAGDDQK